MKAYYRETPGLRTSKPYGNGHSTVEDRPVAVQESLGGIGSISGNYVAANPQTFVSSKTFGWQGSTFVQNTAQSEFYSFNRGTLGYSPGFIPSTTFSDVAYNEALSELFEKLRGSVDLSIDAFQVNQTRSAVAKTLKGVRHLASTFRKMRRSSPRDWGSIWLEFTYMWKPLASTIYDTLDRLSKPDVTFMKVKGRGKLTTIDSSSIQSPTFLGIQEQRRFNISQRCEIQAEFKLTNSVIESLAGYTSLNPASIAWELVPYSFVVDWVVDVGGYLRNLESGLIYGKTFSRGYVTQTTLITGGKSTQGQSTSGNITTTVSMRMSVRNATKKRDRLSTVPFPRVPVIFPQIGTGRLLNASALLSQLLPRR